MITVFVLKSSYTVSLKSVYFWEVSAPVNLIREKSSRLLHLSIINNFVKYILFLLLLQKRRC